MYISTNAAFHLLQRPLIRDLVSRPYDPRILGRLHADAHDHIPEQTEHPDSDLYEVPLVSRLSDTMRNAMSEASRLGFGCRPREGTRSFRPRSST